MEMEIKDAVEKFLNSSKNVEEITNCYADNIEGYSFEYHIPECAKPNSEIRKEFAKMVNLVNSKEKYADISFAEERLVSNWISDNVFFEVCFPKEAEITIREKITQFINLSKIVEIFDCFEKDMDTTIRKYLKKCSTLNKNIW